MPINCRDYLRQEFEAVWKEHMEAFQQGRQQLEAGKTTLAELYAKGKALGKTLEDVEALTPGTMLKPEEVTGISIPIKSLGDSAVAFIPTATQQFINGNTKGLLRALTEFTYLAKIEPRYMFPRQGMGQGLGAYRDPVYSATLFLEDVNKFASWFAGTKLKTVEEIEARGGDILKAMSVIKSPQQYANLAKKMGEQVTRDPELKDSNLWDKARFLFINNLMATTDTLSRNFFGNLGTFFFEVPETFIRPYSARVYNLFAKEGYKAATGGTPLDAIDSVGAWAKGMWDATRYGLSGDMKAMASMVQSGERGLELGFNRYDLQRFANTGTTNPFEGWTGVLAGWPTKFAQATDDIFKVAATRMRASLLLHQRYRDLGIKDIPYGTWEEMQFSNLSPEIFDDAVRVQKYLTFSDEPSAIGRSLLAMRRILPGTEFIAPFVSTPDRVIAYQWNRTPFFQAFSKRWWDEVRSGDPERIADLTAQVLWSNIFAGGIYAGTKAGYFTGGGSLNREVAREQQETGQRVNYGAALPPWLGGGYFDLRSIQPGGALIASVADFAEKFDYMPSLDFALPWNWSDATAEKAQTATQAYGSLVLMLMKNSFDMPMTSQMSTLFSIWDRPTSQSAWDRIRGQLVQTGTAFVMPRGVAQIYREVDPTIREAHSIVEEIPGGGTLRLDPISGEELKRPERMIPLVGPGRRELKETPFRKWLAGMGQELPDWPQALFGRAENRSALAYQGDPLGEYKRLKTSPPLTKEEINQWMKLSLAEPGQSGMKFESEADQLVQSADFLAMNPPDQWDEITSLYRSYMGEGKDKLIEKKPQLEQVYDARRDEFGEFLDNAAERPAVVGLDRATQEPPEPEAPTVAPMEVEYQPGGENQ